MNQTHLEHTLLAVVLQVVLFPLLGAWGAGAVAVALLLGREIAQHEYKLALARDWTWGETKPVAWHEGLWRGWSLDSLFDVGLPALFCAGLAALFTLPL